MKLNRVLILFLTLLMVAGCGAKNHLNRDRGWFEYQPIPGEIGLRTYQPSDQSYNGRLNLLYEKKIKGSADSPLLAQNGIISFITTRQRFVAFDQFSGDKISQIKKRRGFILHPAIKDSLLILVKRSTYGEVQVINLFTGNVVGQRTFREIRSGPIVVSNNLVFGATEGLLALTLPGLETFWQYDINEMVDIPAVSRSGNVYFAADDQVMACRETDGGEVWRTDCGSAVVSDLSLGEYLYLGVADGRIMAIDIINGSIVWDQSLGFQVHGGVAEYSGRIYLGAADGNVYCLSALNGEIIWRFPTEGLVTASPIIYGPAVLVGSHDRHFYSIDRTDGKLIERRRLAGPVTYAAVVDNDRIFVACRSNRLYCFEGSHK